MAATIAAGGPRIVSLDILRGVAVMGILAMNALAFAMPQQAYTNPAAYGGTAGADFWAWALSFVFVDGKMRGLFSLLFGASMLLVVERADAAGGNGGSVHARRMFWLLLFGLAHFALIWWGDILTLYAVIGLAAYAFTDKSAKALMGWAIGFFLASMITGALFYSSPLMLEAAALAPGADPETVRQWQAVEADIGGTPAAIAADIALHQGSWADITRDKLSENWFFPIVQLFLFGLETLAFMLLGMWGLRTGFLTGERAPLSYIRTAAICLLASIPVYVWLAWIVQASGFRTSVAMAASLGGGGFVRPVMVIGYAALIIILTRSGGAIVDRIAATGRAAFTNYIGTSIVMTTIFYGYGFGLYGEVGRAELWLFILGVWALMLLWSKPWLDRYLYGPFEWLWRTLARGRVQPMRKAS